jgi:HK97 family phage major capsid protein
MEAQDPVLAALTAEFESKSAEANRIIADPAATGPALAKAEALTGELEKLQARIDDRREEYARKRAIAGRLAAGRSHLDQPRRTLPFAGPPAAGADGGAGRFRYAGSEPAGSATLAFDPQRKHWDMIQEAGAGLLNQERKAIWELLSSFEYKRDFAMYLRKGARQIDLHQKTLMEGMDDQGGVFAPAELIATVIGRLPAPTHLRSLVTTLTTGRDTLIMPRKQYSGDDQYTTAFRATWTGEIPSDGTGVMTQVNDAGLIGNIDIPVHTAMLSAPVTRNLIEDSAFPIQAWLESELAQIIDLLYENMILNGTGVGQPFGIYYGISDSAGETNNAPEVIKSSTAGGVDYSLFSNMQTALAPQYEESESLRWVMNKRSTLAALQLLVDSQNRPLFTTGYEDSGMVTRRQRRVLGDEITLSQFSPNVGASNYPVVYGDLKGHYVAQRVGFSIQVLDQTRAKANQVELVGRVRFGGRTVEPWRLKVGKSNNS